MAYNFSINVRDWPYSKLSDAILWCHKNLQLDRDWNYSEESAIIQGRVCDCPLILWFNEESDIVALKLAIGI